MTNQVPYYNRQSLPQQLRALGQYTITDTVTVPAGTAGTVQSIAVTFPAGSFTSKPTFVGTNPIVGDPSQYQTCAVSETATGFLLNIKRTGAASFPVRWIAVGA